MAVKQVLVLSEVVLEGQQMLKGCLFVEAAVEHCSKSVDTCMTQTTRFPGAERFMCGEHVSTPSFF